jgi:hypothetical protein
MSPIKRTIQFSLSLSLLVYLLLHPLHLNAVIVGGPEGAISSDGTPGESVFVNGYIGENNDDGFTACYEFEHNDETIQSCVNDEGVEQPFDLVEILGLPLVKTTQVHLDDDLCYLENDPGKEFFNESALDPVTGFTLINNFTSMADMLLCFVAVGEDGTLSSFTCANDEQEDFFEPTPEQINSLHLEKSYYLPVDFNIYCMSDDEARALIVTPQTLAQIQELADYAGDGARPLTSLVGHSRGREGTRSYGPLSTLRKIFKGAQTGAKWIGKGIGKARSWWTGEEKAKAATKSGVKLIYDYEHKILKPIPNNEHLLRYYKNKNWIEYKYNNPFTYFGDN